MSKRDREEEDEVAESIHELAGAVDRALPHLKLRVREIDQSNCDFKA
jgi:predicted transcriptional regulator